VVVSLTGSQSLNVSGATLAEVKLDVALRVMVMVLVLVGEAVEVVVTVTMEGLCELLELELAPPGRQAE
jgi:hypothetical protein